MMQLPMSTDWADETAERLLGGGFVQPGVCLILGGVDTGKTTLAAALTERLAQNQAVGIIDADIGQSHLGPPTTVGWALVDKPEIDLTQITPGGIGFVGDVTPVGHLLQLTAALTQCVREVSKTTERIIIDTPGFITGPAANALWWTVQSILQPGVILAVQRENELSGIIEGLQRLGSHLEVLTSPPEIPTKSPEARRRYRQRQFCRYFKDSCLVHLNLSDLTVQTTRSWGSGVVTGKLVGLRNSEGIDQVVGVIESYQQDKDVVVVRAPQLDISQIRCLVIGDVTVNLAGE